MPMWFCLVLLAVSGCKFSLYSAKTKAADRLPDGPIVLNPGSPQSPNPVQCKSTFTSSTASEMSQSQVKSRNLLVDLAWQFPDVKEQMYGDCYVYGGLASIEAFANRQYKRKPQISLSEPYAAISTFLSPEGFEDLKDRWVDPIVTRSENMSGPVISGGRANWVIYTALQYPETLVLNHEFSYYDLERVATLIRLELASRREGRGSIPMNYREMDGLLTKIETRFNSSDPGAQSQWLATYTKAIRSFYLKRSVNDPNSRSILQGILNNYLKKNPRPPEVASALASLQQAKMNNLLSVLSDGEWTNMYKAGDNLENIYKKIAKDSIAKKQARWIPAPWDVLRSGQTTPSDPTIPASSSAPTASNAELPQVVKACAVASAKLREAISKALCEGIPVSVGIASLGMLTEEEDHRMSEAATKIYSELLDWKSYLGYLATKPTLKNPQNGPTSLALAGGSGNEDEAMSFKEYKKIRSLFDSPSRGDASNDPRAGTYFDSFLVPGEHSGHAMIMDGIESIDGIVFWRLRNSWGGTGSAYFPVAESCRITSASIVTK